MDVEILLEYWPLLLPLFLLQLSLAIAGIVSIVRRKPAEIKGGVKWPWIILCAFFGIVGALVYFAFGRKERIDEDDDENYHNSSN